MEEKEVILTQEGYDRLEKELNYLRTEKRAEIADRIKVALGFGDLSENSEYDEAKNAQAENEVKIAELENKVRHAKIIDEKDIDVVTAISGSGPAFYYYIIEKIAQAGKKLGLDYKTALELSAQTALGSAKMMFKTPDTPEELIRAVTTPGGCTEVGNNVLNNSNIDEILFKTIKRTMEKARKLGG